jgi:asparagine synthase (glutamine-hydrolysing)
MLVGVFERDPARAVDLERLRAVGSAGRSWTSGPVGMLCQENPDAGQALASRAFAQDGRLASFFSGTLYGTEEKRAEIPDPASEVLRAFRAAGDTFAARLEGRYGAALADLAAHRLLVARDPLGLEAVYYHVGPERVVFGSAIEPVLRASGTVRGLDREAVVRFLMFNYNPGAETLFHGVRKLRPGHQLIADVDGVRVAPFWRLSFADPTDASEEELADGILQRTRAAVRRRLRAGSAPAVFLSGGLDSSTVLALLREAWDGPIRTYSYRCRNESFDESHYARLMASSVGAEHSEIEYRAEDALLIADLTSAMNEPFCDAGINVATYLLGRAAARDHHLVFTGDGGDELFGGHPIYEADKIARLVDAIPGVVRRPVLAGLTWLPDSDQKKNLTVKLKRFGENALFPPDLLSHRWRLYYHLHELEQALTPAWLAGLKREKLLADVLDANAEADGPDLLARCLYSDYQTICDFYLRRNDLFSGLGVETRYPLFDRELVEFCARIPSALKVRGWFDSKYIFKKAIEKVLPKEIVHREDKLGHSIPLKNWLREDRRVQEFVLDLVSPAAVERRGIVRAEFVSRLVEDHLARRRNNSHRLWSLAVLELWCRNHLDATTHGRV